MRRASLVLAAATAAAAFVAASASAKAPKPTDLPTVEEIYQQEKTAVDAKKAGATAKKDPTKDAIDAYRDGKSQLADFAAVVGFLKDVKETPEHRNDAANALVERFGKVDVNNPEIRATRRTIALQIIDLMKVDKEKDEVGLGAIERVFYAVTWYRQKMFELKFHATDKQSARVVAWTKMKTFLSKGEN